MTLEHKCASCPHDLTTVRRRVNDAYVTVPIVDLSNEDLLDEYWLEAEGTSRGISSDPPSPEDNLRDEILRRMAE